MEDKTKEIEALQTLKKELEDTLSVVQELEGARRFFYNTGTICIEMNKEEIIELVKTEIEEIENMIKELETK
ncbi:MAG: hypothetical protein GXO22_02040 [Aquificae bacterium]|nr:hypothetical protein [Aquificota bacterium]